MAYDRSHRALEIVLIATHWALTLALLVTYVRGGPSVLEVLLAPLALLPGMLAADLASAVIHFGADRFGSTSTPIFGRNVIRSFREHHDDPKAMTHHDFITIAGDTCLATLPCLVAMLVWGSSANAYGRSFEMFAMCALGCVFMTSQVHKWSHTDEPPALVQRLQRWGILLGPKHHQRHHTAPHDRAYATFTGWLNPLLDESRVFFAFEWLVRGGRSSAPTKTTSDVDR